MLCQCELCMHALCALACVTAILLQLFALGRSPSLRLLRFAACFLFAQFLPSTPRCDSSVALSPSSLAAPLKYDRHHWHLYLPLRCRGSAVPFYRSHVCPIPQGAEPPLPPDWGRRDGRSYQLFGLLPPDILLDLLASMSCSCPTFFVLMGSLRSTRATH